MTVYNCLTCGAQYESEPPEVCRMCLDDRQYVGKHGCGVQEWVTSEELDARPSRNTFHELEPRVISVGLEPAVGIGQHAILIKGRRGNILWDCLYLARDSIQELKQMGNVAAVAISHPHFYTAAADWASAFSCPVYMHEADREWVTRPFKGLEWWTGDELELAQGLTVHRLGGHFPGSSVLLWDRGADRRGALFTGDTILPTPGGASFFYSYPNMLPLPAEQVRRMRAAIAEKLEFDRLYSAFPARVIPRDAKRIVLKSADLYVGLLDGTVSRTYW